MKIICDGYASRSCPYRKEGRCTRSVIRIDENGACSFLNYLLKTPFGGKEEFEKSMESFKKEYTCDWNIQELEKVEEKMTEKKTD